jgi:tetratricopeptide (TPR) repeat protein
MPSADALERLRHYAALAGARPDDADAQMFHGNALAELGRRPEAIEAYRAALLLHPGHGPAQYNLGNALLASGDPAGADAAYEAALALVPDHAGCLNNRGNALRQLGRAAEAAASYRAALALRPEVAGTHSNLASALLALHQPEAALAHLQTALRLDPDYAEACDNMGGALLALDQPEAALPWFRRAVELDSGQVQARFGEAMALLALGRLREGFAAYEARWLDPRFRADTREYSAPLWLGETDPAGRTMLLHAEQGFGDTIQFARYAPLLRARGARVVLEVQAPLVGLLAPLADAVVASGEPLPRHDFRTPLLSLPHACGTELDSIPAGVPYLARREPLAGLRGPGLNVALTIAGNREHPEDGLRSLPAALLAPLLALPGVTWHLVAHELSEADAAWVAGHPALRRAAPPRDFIDTAAVLAAMDLVLSVDTAVAHLAGALGLPVWTLLQHAADFRWLRGREDSPWYPTMRLFRQAPHRRWEPVLTQVAAALEQAAATFQARQ